MEVQRQTIEELMAERGITRAHAYRIYKREGARIMGSRPVNQSLKDALLIALFNGGKCDARALARRIQALGHAEAAHGVVHVVWSLQKDRLVTFRESKQLGLHNIHLTKLGMIKANELVNRRNNGTPPSSAKPLNESTTTAEVQKNGREVRALAAADLRSHENSSAVKASSVKVSTEKTSPPARSFEEKFPLIHRLMTRQARVERAAKILEDEGLVDEAAAALEAVSYTDEQKEIVALAREFIARDE